MNFVRCINGNPVEISTTHPRGPGVPWGVKNGWSDRHDWPSFEFVSELAAKLTAMTTDLYLPIDNSESTSPRFDVVKAPKIGDKVSRAINGDYYPSGVIARITPALTVITDTGKRFRRTKDGGSWREERGYACMVPGHIDERNPHV